MVSILKNISQYLVACCFIIVLLNACDKDSLQKSLSEHVYRKKFIEALRARHLYTIDDNDVQNTLLLIQVNDKGDLLIKNKVVFTLSLAKSEFQAIYKTEATDNLEKYIGMSLLDSGLWIHQIDAHLYKKKENSLNTTKVSSYSSDPNKSNFDEQSEKEIMFSFITWQYPYMRFGFSDHPIKISSRIEDMKAFFSMHENKEYFSRHLHTKNNSSYLFSSIQKVEFASSNFTILRCIPSLTKTTTVRKSPMKVIAVINDNEAFVVEAQNDQKLYRIGLYYKHLYLKEVTAKDILNLNVSSAFMKVHEIVIPAHK